MRFCELPPALHLPQAKNWTLSGICIRNDNPIICFHSAAMKTERNPCGLLSLIILYVMNQTAHSLTRPQRPVALSCYFFNVMSCKSLYYSTLCIVFHSFADDDELSVLNHLNSFLLNGRIRNCRWNSRSKLVFRYIFQTCMQEIGFQCSV